MGQGLPAGAAFEAPPNMIIVSESSAEATLLVRTGCYTTARLRSSAAPNDTQRYADIRPISVHTEEVTGSIPVSPTSTNSPNDKDLQGREGPASEVDTQSFR
jgi:hypothetical protein